MIELHGKATDYRLGSTSSGDSKDIGIFLKESGKEELIGIIVNGQGKNLNLEDRSFSFV